MIKFPRPFEGEDLESLLVRGARYFGYESRNAFRAQILRSSSLFDSLLPLRDLTEGELNPKQCLAHHTLYPLEMIFGVRRNIKFANLSLPYRKRSLMASSFGFAPNEKGPSFYRAVKACPECLKEQKAKFGLTYWKREWFFHNYWYCPKHNIFLRSGRSKRLWVLDVGNYLPAELDWKPTHAFVFHGRADFYVKVSQALHYFLYEGEQLIFPLSVWKELIRSSPLWNSRLDKRLQANNYISFKHLKRNPVVEYWGRILGPLVTKWNPLCWLRTFGLIQALYPELTPAEILEKAKMKHLEMYGKLNYFVK